MHKLYPLVFCLLFAGCSLSGDEEILVSTVQPELRVDLANPLELESDFALRFTTTDETCSTSELLAEGSRQGNQVHVSVEGLLVPASCATEHTQIVKDVEVDLESGTYIIDIALGEELKNFGSLSFDGKEYKLTINAPHGIVIGHDKLRKIPEQIIWGTITSDTEIQEVVEEFNALTMPLTKPFDLPSGYYGHFTVEDGSGINLSTISTESSRYSYPFLLRLKSDTEVFGDALNSFRNQYPGVFEITCTTWTGAQL